MDALERNQRNSRLSRSWPRGAKHHRGDQSHASVDHNLEKYRLQLGPTRGYAEWLSDEAQDASDNASGDEYARIIEDAVQAMYGRSLREIEAEVTPVLQRMKPGYAFRAIPMNMDQEGMLDGDEAYRDSCF